MASFDRAARMGLKGLLRKVRKFSQGHDLPLVNLDESGQTHAFKSPTTRPKREINDDVWSTCFYSRASTAGRLDVNSRQLAAVTKVFSIQSRTTLVHPGVFGRRRVLPCHS